MSVAAAIRDYLNERPSDDELSTLSMREPLSGGQNPKFYATTSSLSWLVKFCRNNCQRVPEVCEREALVSLLGRILGVSVVNAWVIPTSLLTIVSPPQNSYEDIILDRIVLMKLISGTTLEAQSLNAAHWIELNAGSVADIFALMHWIGDEDRGLSDIMLDPNGLVLIDNGLCGPGQSERLRGYHPTPNVYTDDRILLKCYGGGKPSFVEFVLRGTKVNVAELQSPKLIPKIAAFTADELKEIANCVNVAEEYAVVLHKRSQTLSDDYSRWLGQAVSYCRG